MDGTGICRSVYKGGHVGSERHRCCARSRCILCRRRRNTRPASASRCRTGAHDAGGGDGVGGGGGSEDGGDCVGRGVNRKKSQAGTVGSVLAIGVGFGSADDGCADYDCDEDVVVGVEDDYSDDVLVVVDDDACSSRFPTARQDSRFRSRFRSVYALSLIHI